MVDNLDLQVKIIINNEEYYFVPNKFFVNLYNPNYCISKKGELINIKTRKKIKINDNGNGYKQYVITSGGITSKFYIHRVLADLFIENPNNYDEIDHIDRNKSNNSLDNLRWVSRKENLENRGYKLFSNIHINFNKFTTINKKKSYSSNKLSNILAYRTDNLIITSLNFDSSLKNRYNCDGIVYPRTDKISFSNLLKHCEEAGINPKEIVIKKDKFLIYNFVPNNEEFIEYDNKLYLIRKLDETLKYEIENFIREPRFLDSQSESDFTM